MNDDPDALGSTVTQAIDPAMPSPEVLAEHYLVEREIGRGGLGRVLRARDQRLDRVVALKVPLHVEGERRFLREALITARLQHPSIVPVYEAGRLASGRPFYAMKLVEGRTLKEVVASQPDARARLALLPNVLAVAEAVAYAHGQRVVHRDLKPSNILVGEFGETVVLDWGLAKYVGETNAGGGPSSNSSDNETQDGAVLGTPSYMPPEQAAGRPVAQTADVYATGAILYHVLAGVAPYEGLSSKQVLARIAATAPPPLASRVPGLPPDLLAIVDKAMARDPADRYLSARELAEDLRRFQTGQLVSSREYSPWALVARFIRRHRAAVTSLALLVIGLAIIGALSVRRIAQARTEAERRRDALTLAQARTAIDHDPTEALAWLKLYPERGADFAAARGLTAEALSAGASLAVFRDLYSMAAALSSDGNLVAIGNKSGVLRLYDTHTGSTRRVQVGGEPTWRVLFSPDSKSLGATSSKEAVLWDVARFQPGPRLSFPDGLRNEAMAFSPDGRTLALTTGSYGVLLWRPATGEKRLLPGHTAIIHDLSFSPDGRLLASSSHDHTVRLWDVESGAGRVFAGHTDQIRPVRFSPDGKRLLTGSNDGTLRLWDLQTGASRVLAGHKGIVYSASFVLGGRAAVSTASDGTLRRWDTTSGESRVIARSARGLIALIALPGRDAVLSGGIDQAVRVTDLLSGDSALLSGHEGLISWMFVSDDSRLALTLSLDGSARLWDVSLAAPRGIPLAIGPTFGLAWSPDGSRLGVVSEEAVAACEPAQKRCRVLGRHAEMPPQLEFLPDGRSLGTCAGDGEVSVWDVESGAVRVLGKHAAKVNGLAASPDGTHLATASDDNTVRLWDIAAGTSRLVHRHDDRAWSVRFSPDGTRLVSAGLDNTARVWDSRSGKSEVLRGHAEWVMWAAFSPDGSRIATASLDGTVRLWPLAGGAPTVLDGQGGGINHLRFSPDGRQLVASGNDRILRIWDLPTGSLRTFTGSRGNNVHTTGFSPDGRFVIATGDVQTLRLFSVATGEERPVRVHHGRVLGFAFSPDGQLLASVGADGRVSIWPVAELPPLASDPRALREILSRSTSAVLGTDDRPLTP